MGNAMEIWKNQDIIRGKSLEYNGNVIRIME
jgi:hypothetical protein